MNLLFFQVRLFTVRVRLKLRASVALSPVFSHTDKKHFCLFFVASIDFVYPLSVHGQSSRKIGTSWGAPHTPDCTTIKEQNEERNQAKQI